MIYLAEAHIHMTDCGNQRNWRQNIAPKKSNRNTNFIYNCWIWALYWDTFQWRYATFLGINNERSLSKDQIAFCLLFCLEFPRFFENSTFSRQFRGPKDGLGFFHNSFDCYHTVYGAGSRFVLLKDFACPINGAMCTDPRVSAMYCLQTI